MINSPLTKVKLPREWKRANIDSTYRGRKRTTLLNYRPVSLNGIVGKICEIVIQGWFIWRKMKSQIKPSFDLCVTNLPCFYTQITNEVKGRDGWVDSVYLDIKKVFDRVPHRKLLWKTEHIGGVLESTT